MSVHSEVGFLVLLCICVYPLRSFDHQVPKKKDRYENNEQIRPCLLDQLFPYKITLTQPLYSVYRVWNHARRVQSSVFDTLFVRCCLNCTKFLGRGNCWQIYFIFQERVISGVSGRCHRSSSKGGRLFVSGWIRGVLPASHQVIYPLPSVSS